MDEQNLLAEEFEANRNHLGAVAYRMLGSTSEADDAVQEAWLRLSRSDTSDVRNLGGWLRRVRQSSPTPSVLHCSSCSRCSNLPSGLRLCCTTCLPCPSTSRHDRGPVSGGDATTRQPRPSAGAGHGDSSRRRSAAPAIGGRCLLRCRPWRRLRRAARRDSSLRWTVDQCRSWRLRFSTEGLPRSTCSPIRTASLMSTFQISRIEASTSAVTFAPPLGSPIDPTR
jgi:Sigma-70 region 2